MFSSILNSGLTITNFLICIGIAFVLGLIVAFVHMKTAKSNANFATTLAVLPALVAMAIMLVNGNLGAGVATLGVFSLVRFRSIPGNSRSLLAVFFAMAIGLAVGTGYVLFAALFTVVIGLIIMILSLLNFGAPHQVEKKLVIVVPEDLDYTDMFDDIFAKYTKSVSLQKTKTTNMGSLFKLTYRVVLKDDVNEKRFIDKIRTKNGNLKVSLSLPIEGEEL
ncbi:DUF4956 domain-containing protein [Candidatus Saccharibacteria bacterium]|nr:DUF4956 domain-containing protein [Candidatus Saccharibacteria bacterium]MBR0482922.1 DUF4956 domain-containing protein [Candidatus Saccharibacteria bacterium]